MVWKTLSTPIDLVIPLPTRRFTSTDESLRETIKRFNLMYEFVKNKQEVQIARNQTVYTGKPNTFEIGDYVWVYISRKLPGKPDKLTDSWTGPWKVEKIINEVLIQVKPALHEGKLRTIHVTRVRLYYEPKDTKTHKIPEDLDEEDDVDDGDELAENLYPGVQMVEPRDLLLPVSAPQPFDEIKDISFKQPLQPRKQLEAITPLSPKKNENLDGPKETETPMNIQTSEGEDSDVTMSNQTTTPKEQKEPSVQKGQTGGVKRKSFGTPTRTQASRRTKNRSFFIQKINVSSC